MTERAVDEAFVAQNRADDAATAAQTLGNLAAKHDAGRGLPEPFRSLPGTVTVMILTAAVVLGGLYLLWQAREIVGWCVGGCVIAAALDPGVKLLQKHHVKRRTTAILLVYAVLVLGGLGIVGLILPPLVEQIRGVKGPWTRPGNPIRAGGSGSPARRSGQSLGADTVSAQAERVATKSLWTADRGRWRVPFIHSWGPQLCISSDQYAVHWLLLAARWAANSQHPPPVRPTSAVVAPAASARQVRGRRLKLYPSRSQIALF